MTNNETVKIVARFFQAVYALIAMGEIRGKKTFTDKYNIRRSNFLELEKNHESKIFQPGWMVYLIKDFGVSAEWLLLGKGNAFTNERYQRAFEETTGKKPWKYRYADSPAKDHLKRLRA